MIVTVDPCEAVCKPGTRRIVGGDLGGERESKIGIAGVVRPVPSSGKSA